MLGYSFLGFALWFQHTTCHQDGSQLRGISELQMPARDTVVGSSQSRPAHSKLVPKRI